MKILVTGGAGFIGANLCLKLLNLGHEVIVIDNLSPQIHSADPQQSYTYQMIEGKVDFYQQDVSTFEGWKTNHTFYDAIFHLASETGTFQSMNNSYLHVNNNIVPTSILNDLLIAGKIICPNIIFSSSRSVYGESPVEGSKESDQLSPQSVYAITKASQEAMLMNSFPECRVSCLRLQNVYGVGQSLSNPYTGILSIFSNAIKNDMQIEIFSDGMMTRDFVYVDDVVDAFVLMLDRKGKQKEIYNVGSGRSITVLEVAKTLIELYGKETDIHINGKEILGDVRNCYANLEKIRKINYNPQYDFREGVSKFTNWVEQMGNLDKLPYQDVIDNYILK